MSDKEVKMIPYSTLDFVDLYETRAVRQSRGSSYGKKGFRTYSERSESHQEWRHLGRGTFTINGDKCFFACGGQSRTIEHKKINQLLYYNNIPGIEISVSNHQKTMKFLLPGQTIEDGQILADAILHLKSSVILTEVTCNPRKSGGCYIATFVYGDYDAEEVLVLREFRDNTLLKNIFGKLFVSFYYKTIPFLIQQFGSKFFKKNSKKILDKIVKIH
ncbi:MAG: hypothetical protein LBV42_04505 [Methanobrevibacter sp.]|jgi:hypothetical protein|nr:hypothetical protein [Methanobrevibacter sp.]